MATLEDIENNTRTALTTAGYTTAASWSQSGALVVTRLATVKIASSELLDAGSNLSIRTAEVLVTVSRLATDVTSAALVTAEALVNADLAELTAASFWAAITGVRASPLPEIEVDENPERVGRVLSFSLRAQVALEA